MLKSNNILKICSYNLCLEIQAILISVGRSFSVDKFTCKVIRKKSGYGR